MSKLNITRYKMGSIFAEIQQKAKLDYAYTNGVCCGTCTDSELASDYGIDSKGIWLKWYIKGANKSTWASNDEFFIAHDLTEEQKKIVVEVLEQYFTVTWDGSNNTSIKIN